MKHDARKYRTIRGTWFWVPTISYTLALIVCFICNLAANRTLSWFFIVLAALLCAYSFIPTYTSFFKSNKLPVFVGTSFCTICLLLFACAVYTHTLHWVPTACIGILIGYALLFLPLLLAGTKIRRFRFLLSFALSFLLTIALLAVIRARQSFTLAAAIKTTCFGFVPVFLCGILCLFRFDPFLKAGICTLFSALYYYFGAGAINRFFGLNNRFYAVDFRHWEQYSNANVHLILFLSFFFVGAVLLIAGVCRVIKNKEK